MNTANWLGLLVPNLVLSSLLLSAKNLPKDIRTGLQILFYSSVLVLKWILFKINIHNPFYHKQFNHSTLQAIFLPLRINNWSSSILLNTYSWSSEFRNLKANIENCSTDSRSSGEDERQHEAFMPPQEGILPTKPGILSNGWWFRSSKSVILVTILKMIVERLSEVSVMQILIDLTIPPLHGLPVKFTTKWSLYFGSNEDWLNSHLLIVSHRPLVRTEIKRGRDLLY